MSRPGEGAAGAGPRTTPTHRAAPASRPPAAPVPTPPEASAEVPDAVDLAWRRALADARARGLRPGASVPGAGTSRGTSPGERPPRGPGSARGGAARARRHRVGLAPPGSGAHPGARDPQPVGRLTERAVAEAGWGDEVAVGGVMGRWREVVGPDVAEHCEPEGFSNGVLTVRASTTAWATQLRMLAGHVLTRLTDVVGAGVVERIEVRGPEAPSWRRGRLTVRGRGVRDTYG